ncbi:MAG: hypothetical protein M1370_02415 [Bacteroidetes bacterium]|nr:hypothetical protein [Bacteroidota bacterium]
MLLLVALAMGVAACGQANGNSTPAATVRNFMLAGEAHDFDRAYSLFATDEMDRTQIEALLKDYVLFDRFEDLKVDRWMVFAPPDSDRGRLVGTLAYGGGYGGRFEAEMLQRKDGWRLTKMNIIVSREKLQQYEQPTLASPLCRQPAN